MVVISYFNCKLFNTELLFILYIIVSEMFTIDPGDVSMQVDPRQFLSMNKIEKKNGSAT